MEGVAVASPGQRVKHAQRGHDKAPFRGSLPPRQGEGPPEGRGWGLLMQQPPPVRLRRPPSPKHGEGEIEK